MTHAQILKAAVLTAIPVMAEGVCSFLPAGGGSLIGSVIFFCIFLVGYFTLNKIFAIKYISSCFWCIACLIGVVVCEGSDVFLPELNDWAGYYGAFPFAAIFFMVFWLLLSFFDSLFSPKEYTIKDVSPFVDAMMPWLQIIIFTLGTFLFITVCTKPSFVLGVDRFAYDEMLPGYIKRIRNIVQIVLPVVVLFSIRKTCLSRKSVLLIVLCVIPYCAFCVWVGNKFGIFFFMFVCIVSPLLTIQIKTNPVQLRNLLLMGGKLFFLFGAMIFGVLYVQYSSYGEDAKEMLSQRVAQQGQLWWSIYGQYAGCGKHLDELDDELAPLGKKIETPFDAAPFGVNKLMYLSAPERLVTGKLETGSRYSAQGFELLYYYGGFAGLMMSALIGAFLYSLFVNGIIAAILSGRILELVIIMKLYSLALMAYQQGDWCRLTTIVPICLLISWPVVHHLENRGT